MARSLPSLGYVLDRPLGGGRYAELFFARTAQGDVVLKIARGEPRDLDFITNGGFFAAGLLFHTGSVGSWDPDPAAVLDAEAEALKSANHPAFVRLLDEGATRLYDEVRKFITLERIEGETWRALLDKRHLALGHVRELCEALASCGLDRHGDIKPDNLMLDTSGKVRILDPTSKVRAPEGMMGILCTEAYNPTLLESDLPSIGILMIEVLSGQHPVLAGSPDRAIPPLGPALSRALGSADATGGGMRLRRLLRMPLPSELVPGISPELEAIALGCVGLAREGERLELCEDLDVAKVARALGGF